MTEFDLEASLTDVRALYDTVAMEYAALLPDTSAETPAELGMLAEFAARVDGPIVDVGCGTGRITAHLHEGGANISGIDLSPGMIAVARSSNPQLRFDVGQLARLELPDASLGGVLAWYSIIHSPERSLPAMFEEFARVLRPGGSTLLAFQVGTGVRRMTRAYGHDVDCDAFPHDPDRVAGILSSAGFIVQATLIRAPVAAETAPRAALLAEWP
jgi:SAM-dependent methyltransferase